MEKKECAICRKMIKEKYKYHNLFKILTIVFLITTILFLVLFLNSNDLFVQETITQEIIIENGTGNNSNSNIGTITETSTKDYSPIITLVSFSILTGGIIYGSYINKKNKNNTEDKNN